MNMKCFVTGRECEKDLQVNPYKVFVMTPFAYPFDDLYSHGISPLMSQIRYQEITKNKPRPGIDDKLQVDRADQAIQLGFIMCQGICKKIQESNWIIADITQPNRNVFYELGLSYSMGKNIILIGRDQWDSSLHFGLLNDQNKEAYIEYHSLEDFQVENKNVFINALKYPIVNLNSTKERPRSKILNIVNSDYTVKGLHEKSLSDSIREIELETKSRLLNQWEVKTLAISKNSKFDELFPDIMESKVCTIDTTNYDDKLVNPYPFFCLGMGHGLEQEVIPLTHVSRADILPFDVRGLYHIFFDNLKTLKEQFTAIFKEIDKTWYKEKEDYLYKKFWNNFFKEDNDLHIMTCARRSEDIRRPHRTNIDKWDYITVSELTRFISRTFPNSRVHITAPIRKLLPDEIEKQKESTIVKNMKKILRNKDCIIVGSPDVSDLAEILLSQINKIKPYQKNRSKKSGFVIVKSIIQDIQSSFIWCADDKLKEGDGVGQIDENTNNCTCFQRISHDDNGSRTAFGICIIANNPFSSYSSRKVMILAGHTGVATYGIAKFFTDKTYKNTFFDICTSYDFEQEENVEIVIGINYDEIAAKGGTGDIREIRPRETDIFTVADKSL